MSVAEIRLRIMVDGWRARDALEEHVGANEVFGDRLGTGCINCNRFVAARLQGRSTEESRHLACGRVQQWWKLIEEAQEISNTVAVHAKEE